MLKWFSLSGIFTEIKRIRWPKASEMAKNIATVVAFIVAFGLFFVATEFVIANFLRLIGITA
jgi:preprotein translocase subunit SecE